MIRPWMSIWSTSPSISTGNLYHDGYRDYRDNYERFVFLSRAVLETIRC